MQETNKFKACSSINLYNMLQDLRHLVVLDFRPLNEFQQQFVRGSLSIFHNASQIKEELNQLNAKASDFEKKYQYPQIRRFILLSDDVQKIVDEGSGIIQFMDLLQNRKNSKLYYLNETITNFMKQYPFLTISNEIDDIYNTLQSQETQNLQRGKVSNSLEKLLYSFSQFPQILIENEIILGNNCNSNSKLQLIDLKIKSLVDLNRLETEISQDSFKKTEFTYINIPMITDLEVLIDFNEINEKIDALPKPIMIYCQDGNRLTNAIAISYLIWKKKLRYDIASLKVFQMRGTSQINKFLFSQLMQYKPEIIIKKM